MSSAVYIEKNILNYGNIAQLPTRNGQLGEYTNNRINIADYLGIKNEVGLVKEKELTKDDYKQIIKTKAGIDDNSIQYLDFYRYGNDLIRKLANAMKQRKNGLRESFLRRFYNEVNIISYLKKGAK